MFADYLQEREGKLVKSNPKGFAIYGYNCIPGFPGTYVYIQDIYTGRDYRKTGVAKELADEIAAEAKSQGVNAMVGSVDCNAHGAHESLQVLMAYGMKLFTVSGQTIYMVKEL